MSGGGGQEAPKMPKFQRQAMKQYAGDGIGGFLDNYDPQFFGGQTYADQSAQSQQGINQLGNIDYGQSSNLYQNTIQGDYLGLNPAFQSAVMNPAMDATASRFNMAGRYGSPSSQINMAESGMRALAPFYDAERGRQMQAAGLYPQMQQQQAGNLLQAGQLGEQYAQQPIDEEMARFNFEQNKPYDMAQKYGSLLGPLGGVQPVGGDTPGGSSLSGALGGAMLGGVAGNALSAGTMLGAGPASAAMLGLGPAGWAALAGGAVLGSGIL